MSDAVEKTAAGATRGFLGSLSFILLMLGLEMLTDKSGIQLGLGFFLIIFGAICAYAAFFWESAKKILSMEAQVAIGRFSQSRMTWFGMLFLILQTIILSRFVEEHRWPFSFPADPGVIVENSQLKNDLNARNGAMAVEKSSADKWRFASLLRSESLRWGNSSACKYQFLLSPKASGTQPFWQELFDASGWTTIAPPYVTSEIYSRELRFVSAEVSLTARESRKRR